MGERLEETAREDSEDGLERLNELTRDEAHAVLLACCGSNKWARRVAEERPFQDERQLYEAAERAWWSLDREDWLEAFRSHPKIGERKAERETGEAARSWSEQEQAAARASASETMEELAELNRVYEERLGHIYIVCATGKSSEEMLDILKHRLSNDPDTELCVAAEEQRKITRIRLEKLLDQK